MCSLNCRNPRFLFRDLERGVDEGVEYSPNIIWQHKFSATFPNNNHVHSLYVFRFVITQDILKPITLGYRFSSPTHLNQKLFGLFLYIFYISPLSCPIIKIAQNCRMTIGLHISRKVIGFYRLSYNFFPTCCCCL